MAHMFETGYFAEIPAWHRLGTVGRPLSGEETRKAAGLDWIVTLEAISYDTPHGLMEVDGYKAVVRSSDHKALGVVSDRYQPIQNYQVFELLDLLAGRGDVVYEAAGSLRGGATVFMLARVTEDARILGDAVHPYILGCNHHDGMGAGAFLHTPVRVVCWNTLNQALQGATRVYRVRHIGDVRSKLEEAGKVLGMSTAYIQALRQQAEELYRIRVSEEKWNGIVDGLLPLPEEGTDLTLRRVREQRADLRNVLYVRPDLENFRWTGWGAVNAVADWLVRREPVRKTKTVAERRFEETFIGTHPLLTRTVELVRSLS